MTVRIALTLLLVIPAGLAYPWPVAADRWLLGVAVAGVLVLWGRWRGLFFPTIVGYRLALWRRNRTRAGRGRRSAAPSRHVTAILRLDAYDMSELPLPLLVGYLDRYGIRCDNLRLTQRARAGQRRTWLSLTLGATDNLAALRARSPRIPLRETAEVTARRLADQLREAGWGVSVVENTDIAVPANATETWRGLRDGHGFLAAYRVAVDDRLTETLREISSHPALDTWTALEISGTAARPGLTVGCALRTEARPAAADPLPGLTAQRGRHRPALEALDPQSVRRLEGHAVALPAGLFEQLDRTATALS